MDTKELDRFSRMCLRGFFRAQVKKPNLIEYTAPIGISLTERFKKPVTKHEFLLILEQLVVAVQKIHANHFGMNALVMKLENVYINEVTKELQFIYIPTTNCIENKNLIEFIEAIAYSITPAAEKDTDVVSRFMYYFRSLSPFDINKIDNFIKREDRSVIDTIRKQNIGQSGFMTNKQQHYYEHYDNEDEPTDLLSDDDPTGLLNDPEDEPTGLLNPVFTADATTDESTTVLIDGNYEDEATGLLTDIADDDATCLLNEKSSAAYYPTLFRTLTQERILINKPVFRLGKEKSYVDYFVTNNIAVSRSHADIIARNGHYFIKDLNSKNHTFVNGVKLPINTETEIHDGDSIKLANEEFVFNI